MRKMSEKQEQIALFERASLHPICSEYMFHVPNGGRRDLKEAISLKRQGVKPGVPDIFLAYPNKGFNGLFIELKSSTGKLTWAQAEMLERLSNVGYAAWVCVGWVKAWETIEGYLGDNINKENSYV